MHPDQNALATLTSVSTEVEADLIVGMLNEHGIAAVATGGYTSQFQAQRGNSSSSGESREPVGGQIAAGPAKTGTRCHTVSRQAVIVAGQRLQRRG